MPLEYQLTTNGMSLNCQWNVNWLSMECHSTATNWHSSDIRVTVQWKLNVTWVSLEFVCLFFVCIFVCLFVQVTFKWHSSDSPVAELSLECHSTVTGMSFMAHSWHKGGGLGNNTPFVSQVEWHSIGSQITFQWLLTVEWHSIGSQLAFQWQWHDTEGGSR